VAGFKNVWWKESALNPAKQSLPDAVRETSSYPVADLVGRVFLRGWQFLELLVLWRAKDRRSNKGAMNPELSKQQQAVLTRAQIEGGTCRATTAYAALVEGGTLRESNEGSILASASSTLQSLVELGLIVKSGPGEYHLTKEGSRVAQSLGEKYPFA
jgi:hypothetical protein